MLAHDLRWLEQSRKDAVAGVGDTCRVQAGDLPLTAHLHQLQLANDGVAIDGLGEPEKPVGHREHCAVVLAFRVLSDEKRGGLEAREL